MKEDFEVPLRTSSFLIFLPTFREEKVLLRNIIKFPRQCLYISIINMSEMTADKEKRHDGYSQDENVERHVRKNRWISVDIGGKPYVFLFPTSSNVIFSFRLNLSITLGVLLIKIASLLLLFTRARVFLSSNSF